MKEKEVMKENKNLKEKYTTKIQQLFELGREPLLNNTLSYEEFGFTKKNLLELIELVVDDPCIEMASDKYEKECAKLFYAGIHAINVLGRLKAVEVLPDLLEEMEYRDGEDEFFNDAFIDFIENVGSASLDILEEYIFENPENYELIGLIEGIEKIAENEPSSISRIEEMMVRYIKNEKTEPSTISFAISALIDISKDKHIDLIREAFLSKEVDELMRGDIEDIEIELGLREQRETMMEDNLYINELINALQNEKKNQPYIETKPKVGRNEPCPCGSGKKYKKCCLQK